MINGNIRFLGVDSTKVDLTERKDSSNNAVAEYYTAEEIAGGGAGGGLEGTSYVYVTANGTATENATELQNAYNLAKQKVQSPGVVSLLDGITNISGGMVFFYPNNQIEVLTAGQIYNFKVDGNEGSGTVVFADEWGFSMVDVTIGLGDGYFFSFELETTVPEPATVVVGPGYFDFATDFLVDTEYVNIVSLDGNRSIIFSGAGTISILANNVFVKGVDVLTKNFTIADNLNLLKVENCKGGNYSFGHLRTASGTFTNCTASQYSFAYGGQASGIFTNCTASDHSFASAGQASGTFTECISGYSGFGGGGGTASGVFTDCTAGNSSFASYGEASGVFTDCTAGGASFARYGMLTGQLYYCRLTQGDIFENVLGAGITRLCIDGLNEINNQG